MGGETEVSCESSNSGGCNGEVVQVESEDEVETIPGLSPEGTHIHSKIVHAFTAAFAKQNVHFEKAIQSLDSLNEQLIAFIFSPQAEALHLSTSALEPTTNGESKSGHGDAVRVAISLMRKLLLDAQTKFRKMVEENKSLGGRLDGDLTSAHEQMALLRAELTDTNKRLSQLSSPPLTPAHDSTVKTFAHAHSHKGAANGTGTDGEATPLINGVLNYDSLESEPELDLENLTGVELKAECEKARDSNKRLKKQLQDMRYGSAGGAEGGAVGGVSKGSADPQTELQHAKAALSALKSDRKRLKAEKFELLNQMKALYVTLEDKEKELREFIRNYEQRMSETEGAMGRLVSERDEAERERWSILRHAREEAERGLALATQLNLREAQIHQMQEELHQAKRQLSQYGLYSEPERSSSTNATSHYSLVSSLTATYATVGDRGSSADSGVRLSSDRDSAPGHTLTGNLSDSANEGISLDMCGDGSGDGDSMSVISTATLPQLFATPRDSPGPLSYSSLTRSIDNSALSRSAEQLLAVEAMEAAQRRGKSGGSRRSAASELSGRMSTGAKGAWGSISRVFARNKHRRNLDPSIYDGLNGSGSMGGGPGQRSSWSPQSSSQTSPLTEQETYSDKLRQLEEAATLPMELWRAGMVQAWIEVSLGMPQYGARCGDNIKSGKVLLELNDGDLETELGIGHPLHRKKLRLAIEEHRNPALVRFPCIVELSHVWVSSEWLPDIGLPQYAESFNGGLVDARLLDHLSKKDLEKYLGVTRKFHLAAIAHGVHLLRIVAYDRQNLAERRRGCENDPLVWTNQHFIQWARSIDLHEYADNLKGSGVHGAFAVLEPSFNGDTMASAMGIPSSKQIIRRHLNVELEALLTPAIATIRQKYRISKGRNPAAQAMAMGTLDKHRSDSLGRNQVPPSQGPSGSSAFNNDSFRRSSEENRRRTSLRGSLSRAFGLKVKAEHAAVAAAEKEELQRLQQQQEEWAEQHHRHMAAYATTTPPPLPPNQPGKVLIQQQQQHGHSSSLNGDYSPLHSFRPPPPPAPAPPSLKVKGKTKVTTTALLSPNPEEEEQPQDGLLVENGGGANGGGGGNAKEEEEIPKKGEEPTPSVPPPAPGKPGVPIRHRRGLSVGKIEVVVTGTPTVGPGGTVHTPV